MNYVIILLGSLITVMGLLMAVRPSHVLAYLQDHADRKELHASAIVVRLVLGIALVSYAEKSKFPVTLHVIGWILIVAAIILLLIGRERMKRLIHWATTFARPFASLAGIAAILLGGFLVYSVLE